MRLALLVASSYSESPELLELPSAEVDLDLLGQRLRSRTPDFE
jgi:hypothetical protein